MSLFIFTIKLDVAANTGKGESCFAFAISRRGDTYAEAAQRIVKEFDNPLVYSVVKVPFGTMYVGLVSGLTEKDYERMVRDRQEDREARQRQYDAVAIENEKKRRPTQ